MQLHYKVIVLLSFTLILTSCRKEEKVDKIYEGQIDLNDEYGIKPGQAGLGNDYEFRSYFDLSSNQNVKTVFRDEWDLEFSFDNVVVRLNHAKSNFRAAITSLDWNETPDPNELEFSYDLPSAEIENLAIQEDDLGKTIVINRGFSAELEELGFKKIKIQFQDDHYTIQVANLDNSNEVEYNVFENQGFSFSFLNLDSGEVNIAPEDESWDIIFTSYLYIFDPETEPFPYQVTGVILNPHLVEATEVTDIAFENFNHTDLSSIEMSSNPDVIGYDWKYYDFDLGYITDADRLFIIKSVEGDYFKLRFTGFYNDEGDKGYPQFEFQKIREF